MALMLCDSEFLDQATGQCSKWVEYVPLIPELTNEQIGTIWLWFFVAMALSWGGKRLIRLWG